MCCDNLYIIFILCFKRLLTPGAQFNQGAWGAPENWKPKRNANIKT